MKFRVQSVHFCSSSPASRAARGAKSDSTHSNFIVCSFHLFSILLFDTDRVSNSSKMRSRVQFHHFCCLFAAFSAFQVRPLVSSSASGVARIKVIQLIQTPLSLQQHSQDDSIHTTCDINLRMKICTSQIRQCKVVLHTILNADCALTVCIACCVPICAMPNSFPMLCEPVSDPLCISAREAHCYAQCEAPCYAKLLCEPPNVMRSARLGERSTQPRSVSPWVGAITAKLHAINHPATY